jgi:hypothetical protein
MGIEFSQIEHVSDNNFKIVDSLNKTINPNSKKEYTIEDTSEIYYLYDSSVDTELYCFINTDNKSISDFKTYSEYKNNIADYIIEEKYEYYTENKVLIEEQKIPIYIKTDVKNVESIKEKKFPLQPQNVYLYKSNSNILKLLQDKKQNNLENEKQNNLKNEKENNLENEKENITVYPVLEIGKKYNIQNYNNEIINDNYNHNVNNRLKSYESHNVASGYGNITQFIVQFEHEKNIIKYDTQLSEKDIPYFMLHDENNGGRRISRKNPKKKTRRNRRKSVRRNRRRQ